jgi:hypothetical protein
MNQLDALYNGYFVELSEFGRITISNWINGVLKDVLELKKDSIKLVKKSDLLYLPIYLILKNDISNSNVIPND